MTEMIEIIRDGRKVLVYADTMETQYERIQRLQKEYE